ncbi:MAG: CapA family protein [Pseudomonadota bacterium]|nr:CapA family protein [Pseudomonadota bacterium]
MLTEQASSQTPVENIRIFLSGDVMTGRGIDQILPRPCQPKIYESYLTDARDYIKIAEQKNGPIPRTVDYAYIWGDALTEWQRMKADIKIINLETSITQSDDYWKNKGINYRMHPQNIASLTCAQVDCCVLANNHVLDWGYSGLTETLNTLQMANLKMVGAGQNQQQASAPAIIDVANKGRVLVFSFAHESSGVPSKWEATAERAGVNLLKDLSGQSVKQIAQQVKQIKQSGDIVVFSVHWGGNWGYDIPPEQINFAHQLIDHAAVDVIHGHSSHHVKGIEIYQGKPILYGCGDFLNDYEGIGHYEAYRGDLALMYFLDMNPTTGKLQRLHCIPTQTKHFQIHRAPPKEADWLSAVVTRECAKFDVTVNRNADHSLTILEP